MWPAGQKTFHHSPASGYQYSGWGLVKGATHAQTGAQCTGMADDDRCCRPIPAAAFCGESAAAGCSPSRTVYAVCGVWGLRPCRGSTALQALRHFKSGSRGQRGRAHTSDRGEPGLRRSQAAEDYIVLPTLREDG